MSRLFDTTLRVLEIGIEGRKLKHQIIVNNLANVDTPGFQSSDLKFEEALGKELQSPNPNPPRNFEERIERLANKKFQVGIKNRVPSNQLKATIVAEAHDQPRLDGNTVDIDREMNKLTKNTLLHNAYIELLNRKFSLLKIAISRNG
ncbi:MAG: flagellar basal body rod protein FlgB [Candidatus Poribacteria bacterium]